MTDRVEEDRLAAAGFEPAHVELDWYDGPQAGLADVDGVPHYCHRTASARAPGPNEGQTINGLDHHCGDQAHYLR